jgi:transposase
MTRPGQYSREVRERAVRTVFEHAKEYIRSEWPIAGQIGCTAETLRKWVRQVERDESRRPGLSKEERTRLKELERENRELRRVCSAWMGAQPTRNALDCVKDMISRERPLLHEIRHQ